MKQLNWWKSIASFLVVLFTMEGTEKVPFGVMVV